MGTLGSSNGCSSDVGLVPQRVPPTVEEVLNEQIERARKNVEQLCIAKAKAETLGLLKYPYNEMVAILGIY